MAAFSQLKCIVCLLKFSKYLYYTKKIVCVLIYSMLAFVCINSVIRGKISISKIKGWLN